MSLATAKEKEPEPGYQVSMGVTLMSVQVAVLDGRGRYRTDLEPADFKLFVDGKAQPIEGVELTEEDPLDLAVLLDVSGSMRYGDKLERSRWMIKELLRRMRPKEPVALMIFADGRIETPVSFTEDRAKLLAALEKVEAYGKTALSDALAEAGDMVDAHDSLAPALILITDALENASHQPFEKTLEHLRWKGVPVYALALVEEHQEQAAKHPDAGSDYGLLQRIADDTGGRFFAIDTPSAMLRAVNMIEKDLRSRYRLSFYGSDSEAKPTLLDVKVEKKNFRVRCRRGYRP